MKNDLETKFTGWAFIGAAALLWGGWMLLPHHIGEYFLPSDFEEVNKNLWFWIWMYRVHIFGWVGFSIAMFALISNITIKPYSPMVIAGGGVIIAGTFVLALSSAFYYGFGAWGVGQTLGKTSEEIQQFMDNIIFTNYYATCFTRFGRVFTGAGMALIGVVFIKWNILNTLLNWFTLVLGFVIMGVILLIPENFEPFKPVFHIEVLWMLIMGIVILKNGVNVPEANATKH